MQKMGLNEIREKYLAFFESKDHLRMRSFSLIPKNDPSILLINAGMTPLKPYFTGAQKPPSTRVTTCQKCIRTPDIERVGKTARHGTFFEMLGNFSFGDYFKEDAISWAWEFCTEVLMLPVERLAVTVYLEDDEAYDIWRDVVGLPESKIFRMGKEDNFWEHGTGPCGPCSEIFFDRGEDKGCKSPECNVGCDCDRFVEFWNLVFTQFNREEDGTYSALEKKNIDTGGGLERFACIMQGVDNLFEVDTVRAILDFVCSGIGVEYGRDEKTDVAIRVITDHARSTVMMISDGIIPDNAGRGYVLRRLLRRASRFARLLGKEEPFLYEAAKVVIRESAKAYPELSEKEAFILRVILKEEESFARTVDQGTQMLLEEMKKLNGISIIPGDIVFKLHDTFGFPVDLTREIASENGFEIDHDGFLEAMRRQKEINREIALKKKTGAAWSSQGSLDGIDHNGPTRFTGYDELETRSVIEYIVRNGDEPGIVEEAGTGEAVSVIVPVSPFYAQSGGQVGDTGVIRGDGFIIKIEDTVKTVDGVFLHNGNVEDGVALTGAEVSLEVDRRRRLSTARNHTTTHLLHKALRDVLGDHVSQAGSDVSPDRLRFDFTHFSAMTTEERAAVERIVNDEICADDPVVTDVMTVEEARGSGAMALFDEKYGDKVRVVSVGNFSKELCGGTHLESSSRACLFRIISESAVAAGVRRIEGVTGEEAILFDTERDALVRSVADTLKTNTSELARKAEQVMGQIRLLEKRVETLSRTIAMAAVGHLASEAEDIGGVMSVCAVAETADPDELREMTDLLRDRLDGGAVLLASRHGDKLSFVCMAGKKAVELGVHAGNVVKAAASAAGGGGGGRPDMAQAGAKNVLALNEAVEAGRKTLISMIR
ncbi:MAG: alanine--tRNA ligase [Eubacteriales bacterium]|nr:alanine--tRNA ligase [Eubacteriales bacterium]MDD4717180.1 alanine--tRNA ligase [Eubacteriales bacterium]